MKGEGCLFAASLEKISKILFQHSILDSYSLSLSPLHAIVSCIFLTCSF